MRNWINDVALGAIVIAAAIVYTPGLHGPFVLDDAQNITLNESVALKTLDGKSLRAAIAGIDSGLLKRPIPAFTFALNHYFADGFESSFAFKATNLVIHLLNALLVWLLCRAFLDIPLLRSSFAPSQRPIVAAAITALWVLHPIQITNVLYVVQRMNSLATLWLLIGLLLYLHGRRQLIERPRKALAFMSAGAATGMILGGLSKENAILWPLFAITIEATLLQPPRIGSSARSRLVAFYTTIFTAVVVVAAIAFFLQPDLVQQSYAGRSFSPLQRILTETRVLWSYFFAILVPDVRYLGLFHDDIAVSSGLLQPLSTAPAMLGWILIAVLAVIYRRRYPFAAFAVLWFLVGHSLESGILGLDLAHVHRNYLPSLGLIAGAVFLIQQCAERRFALQRAIHVLLAMAITLLGVITWNDAYAWRDAPALAAEMVRRHPNSPRANAFAARVNLMQSDIPAAIHHTVHGIRIAPHEAGFQIDLHILLALLAQDIEQRPDRTALRAGTPGSTLQIPGVDAIFGIGRDKTYLRLSYRNTADPLPTLLAREPITGHTIFSIEQLTTCIVTADSPCKRLHADALMWVTIAAANTNAPRDYRAIVAADTAILYADSGNYSSAYEYMTRASDLLPRITTYDVLRAQYLIQLCNMEEAQRLMDVLRTKSVEPRRLQELDAAMHAMTCKAGFRRPGT
ncbi:MAG TPA: hypothetical protein VJS66_05585 [Burkholderiales bacterium]|nr:hypothetical protein [Burkholderiales bacterium]